MPDTKYPVGTQSICASCEALYAFSQADSDDGACTDGREYCPDCKRSGRCPCHPNDTDAIRRAQAWLADVAEHKKPPVRCEDGPRKGKWDWDSYNEIRAVAESADSGLAALGPASVALAVALLNRMELETHLNRCDVCERRNYQCEAGLLLGLNEPGEDDALAAWREAVCGEAE